MKKSVSVYLYDILEYVNRIETYTHNGETEFRSDTKTQDAVARAYEIIGEIVKRLPQETLELQPHVDWKAIKGFRDILIHQYDNIDLDRVWDAVEKLPSLRAAVEAMLASLPPEEDEGNEANGTT
jgi:uncharacterized protein with HEPN domain